MKKIILTTASATLLFLATDALAQMGAPDGERPARPEFATVDTDEDGFLSTEEFKAVPTGNFDAERMMSRMDADKDGLVSLTEYTTRPTRDTGGKRDTGGSH